MNPKSNDEPSSDVQEGRRRLLKIAAWTAPAFLTLTQFTQRTFAQPVAVSAQINPNVQAQAAANPA